MKCVTKSEKFCSEFIARFEASEPFKERFFHFSAKSIAKLKAKANEECNTNKISSFQSLSALVWRSITRVRNLKPNQITTWKFAANSISRLDPPLPENYFGNAAYTISGFTTAGELLEHDLGWAAWKLYEVVANLDDKAVRGLLHAWHQSPHMYQPHKRFDPLSVKIGSSPRFNKYEYEFGMGKALVIRSGYANKYYGQVWCYPGREGGRRHRFGDMPSASYYVCP